MALHEAVAAQETLPGVAEPSGESLAVPEPREALRAVVQECLADAVTGLDTGVVMWRVVAAADEYAAALIRRHASSPREQQDRSVR